MHASERKYRVADGRPDRGRVTPSGPATTAERRPTRAPRAPAAAASCSAAFFVEPLPTPSCSPSISAAQTNRRSCGGPSTVEHVYCTCAPVRASASWSSVLESTWPVRAYSMRSSNASTIAGSTASNPSSRYTAAIAASSSAARTLRLSEIRCELGLRDVLRPRRRGARRARARLATAAQLWRETTCARIFASRPSDASGKRS